MWSLIRQLPFTRSNKRQLPSLCVYLKKDRVITFFYMSYNIYFHTNIFTNLLRFMVFYQKFSMIVPERSLPTDFSCEYEVLDSFVSKTCIYTYLCFLWTMKYMFHKTLQIRFPVTDFAVRI